MPLATLIAGPYSCTHDATSVGQTQDGFRLRQSWSKDAITSDTYGDSVIDAVYRGGNMFLGFLGIEFSAAEAVLETYGSSSAGLQGLVGRLDVGSTLANATVLTAVSGTTAAATPATLTSSQTIVLEGNEVASQYASRLRTMPIELRCYLYDTGSSAPGWFTVT